MNDQANVPGNAPADHPIETGKAGRLAPLTRDDVSVPQTCCVHFDGFASMVGPGRGWGAIGWVTDQGDPHWATEQFKVRYCPFCGTKLRGPNGETLGFE